MDFRDILLPEDLVRDLERGARMMEGEFSYYSEERRIRHKDGSRRWMHLTVSLIYSAGEPESYVGMVQDITEQKRDEEALRQSEELYRTVVEQAAENIFIVDVETKRILETNASLRRSLGYTPEEFEDNTLYDIVAHDRHSVDRNTQSIIEEGRRFLGERRYRRKDGSLVEVEVSASTIFYEGGEAMSIVAHDITERKRAEERLRQSFSVLLALQEASQILNSTLSSEEIVVRLLEIMRSASNLTAAVISMAAEQQDLRVRHSVGLDALWDGARYVPEAQAAREAALANDAHCLFRLRSPDSSGAQLVCLCLPLGVKNQVFGVLETYGPESLADNDIGEILSSLSSQAASALENAWLYEEVEQNKRALQELIGNLFGTQEEERRRVAYEVHDGLAQVAVAAHQSLQVFARRHTPNTERGRRELEQILGQVRATVSDARRIIAHLRSTALDNLGLAAALSLEVEYLREDGCQVDFEENFRDQRLPDRVEIALFRIAQEALRNVRKHAQTRQVRIRLEHSGNHTHLEVQDYGRGFDPVQASAGSGPGERVGLAGMRERAGMLGGELEIHTEAGAGTSIVVTVPVS